MKLLIWLQKNFFYLAGPLTLLGIGSYSSIFSVQNLTWYHHLAKPFFTPPDQLFGLIWPIFYILMGVIMGDLIKHHSEKKGDLLLFLLQLSLNFLWSPLFFKYHHIGYALIDVLALWMTLMAFIYQQRNNKLYLLFLLPYFSWITFALLLNIGFYILNS